MEKLSIWCLWTVYPLNFLNLIFPYLIMIKRYTLSPMTEEFLVPHNAHLKLRLHTRNLKESVLGSNQAILTTGLAGQQLVLVKPSNYTALAFKQLKAMLQIPSRASLISSNIKNTKRGMLIEARIKIKSKEISWHRLFQYVIDLDITPMILTRGKMKKTIKNAWINKCLRQKTKSQNKK